MKKINHIDYNGIIEINRNISVIPAKETPVSVALITICQKQQEIIEKMNEMIDFIDKNVVKKAINEPVIQDIIIDRNSTANPYWNK